MNQTPQKNKLDPDPIYGPTAFGKTAAVGLVMGMADAVPGVSGGTVALVLGIYQRLISSISKFDRNFVHLLRNREFRSAGKHVDFGFLMSLLCGIAVGLIATVLTLARLLSNPTSRPFVLATFFGLVVGSVWIVAQMILNYNGRAGKRESSKSQVNFPALIVGMVIAGVICWMAPNQSTGNLALAYIFLSGMVAICAMILPGISGALILLLLGAYAPVVDALKGLLHRENLSENFMVVAVFSAGCLVGLLTFSKILKRLLEQRYVVTMSMLCGLMIGSLMKLWPYQVDLTPEIEEFKHKVFQVGAPTAIDVHFFSLLGTIVTATAFVLVVHRIASGSKYGPNHSAQFSSDQSGLTRKFASKKDTAKINRKRKRNKK